MNVKHALRVFLTRAKETGFLKTALFSLKKFSGIEEHDREIESLYYIVNHCIDITKIPPASGNLRKYQMCTLSLLKTFDAICKKQGWSYWLHAGTLLGAARHKGFIPWDDDIDVAMPRKDYNEALSKLHEICALYSSDLKSRGDIVMGKLQYGNVFIDLFPCDEILSDSEDNDETEAIRHAEQKVDKYAKFFYAHTKANKKIDKKEYDNIINERNSIFYEGGGG